MRNNVEAADVLWIEAGAGSCNQRLARQKT